jgi:ribonuclease HI
MFKIYVDASFSDKNKFGKIAIVIEDKQGDIINRYFDHMCATTSAELEFKAVIEAVNWCYEQFVLNKQDVSHFAIYTDNEGVYQIVNKNDFLNKSYKLIKNIDNKKITDFFCKYNLLKSNFKFGVRWIPRELNRCADKLSKMAVY